ncbi:MAG TPA: GNAT family N-acetyltransferase [Bacillota bacterium]|nr:GNAT family N-acetyltransferase [Bacillota bacterium]
MNLTDWQRLNIKNLAYDTMNLAKYHPKMDIWQTEHFVAVNSHLPSYNFNMITPIASFAEAAKEQLLNTIETFNKQQLPFNMWCYTHDIELTNFLQKVGLTEYDTAYKAMVVQLDECLEKDVINQAIQIERVTSLEQLRKFIDVLTMIYEETIEQQAIKQYYEQLSHIILQKNISTHLYIGTYNGKVVATGALTYNEQSVGMYHIATDPAYRGFGIASEVIRYLLNVAKQSSAVSCTLQASPAAERIYESFGFQTIGYLKAYENKNMLND